MLIEFSVANFRSFRERQTLSMVAAPRIHKRNNVFPAPMREAFPALLKAAVIYGPNASGKSNLLRALSVIEEIADRKPEVTSQPLPVTGFAFDQQLRSAPSEFEIHFVANEMRYQFVVHATAERIVKEELTSFPNGEDSLVYSRHFDGEKDLYSYGSIDASDELLRTWQKLTPPKNYFIAQAVANSDGTISELNHPFTWIKSGVFSLLNGMTSMTKAAQELIEDLGDAHAASLASFLHDVDIPISKIEVQTVSRTLTSNSNDTKTTLERSSKVQKMMLTHTTDLGSSELSLEDESDGTKNLIGFWLPWSIRDIPLDGFPQRVLVVDELDSSLHPLIVAALVKRHLEADFPTQLIFSTHDTHLMDSKLLRRDQIWLTERDKNGATRLTSVHEFEGREGEDIEKRYYDNRYRGLPLLRGAK